MNFIYKRKQQGFTLIEMLIGIVVGVIAIAAVLSVVSSVVRANINYLRMVHLNQELNAAMTLMTRDLRRAGFYQGATGTTSDNIFMTATTDIDIVGTNCILFSYDADADSQLDCPSTVPDECTVVGVDERFGFRLDATNAIEFRESGLACTPVTNAWEDLTDNAVVQITELTFTDDYLSVTSSGDEEIRYIDITLTGQLTNDSTVFRTIVERVKVRNDRP